MSSGNGLDCLFASQKRVNAHECGCLELVGASHSLVKL